MKESFVNRIVKDGLFVDEINDVSFYKYRTGVYAVGYEEITKDIMEEMKKRMMEK